MFYPKEEHPPSGKLIIGTQCDTWEIELVGSGKESVILFSKRSITFENCIIGNSYEQQIILKNIGDVNYPLSFTTNYGRKDFKFLPECTVIHPYKEKKIIITYTPSVIDSTMVLMKSESPYSVNELPINISSGTVKLEFNMMDLDYGIFEKNTRPCKILKMKNCGSMKTSYVILERELKSIIRLSTVKGYIKAGETIDIKVSLINNEVGEIKSELLIYTDLLSDEYVINIHGVCEESILNPEEFKLVDMGINPTNSQVIKPLIIKNYGKFPLSYRITYLYPIKLSRKIGVIDGNDEHIINVIWVPNGSYDLRSTLTMETNIGNYNILVRGKSAFPEISLNRLYIDYGIKAIGLVHKETIELSNNGIVPLKWTAYQSRTNPNFSISKDSGSLLVKEKVTLDILFKPSINAKFSSSYIIECKGRSYKEVNMVGVGGSINIYISPREFNIGNCPCNNSKEYYFTIFNASDLPLDLEFEYETIENLEIYLPEPMHLNINEKKLTKLMILPKIIGNFKTVLLIKTKDKNFKYTVNGSGYMMKITEKVKDIIYNSKTINQNYIHPWEKLTKIDDYDFWYNVMSCGIKHDINLLDAIIKLLKFKKYNGNNENISNEFSKNSILDDSISILNSERSTSRNLRRPSRCSYSSSNTIIPKSSSRVRKINDKKKDPNINKTRIMTYPSRDIVKINEKKQSFKNNILKMNKIIEKDKKEIHDLVEEYEESDIDSALTTYNYREYLVKTFDGRVVYHRNGPLINNFFKQFENRNQKKEEYPKIKSILKKPMADQELVKNNNNDEIENNLLVKMKQDDINNDIYVEITNSKNEKNIKKQHFNFERMTMIHENEEIDDGNESDKKNVNNNYNDNQDIKLNNTNTDNDTNDTVNNDINETNNNIEIGANNSTNDTIKNENNETLNIENTDVVTTKSNNSGITEIEANNYNRKDLLNFLNIDNIKSNKDEELSNEEFKLKIQRAQHNQEFLTKMEYYQNILNVATVSALTMVDLIEHNIDVRPIIQNIIYNIQHNISLFTEEDIKNLEEMFVEIKLFKSKPKVTIKDKYDKIIDKIIDVPYPKTKVSSLKELLQNNEPDLELDISPIISRPSPFLFKRTLFEVYDVNKKDEKDKSQDRTVDLGLY
ncbi:hypothetical protein PIROE2DRAFT_11657 [Piromyces sp. E2]|nr:hypothetical protein PIROE2DRAFT_11657 [Piromyces sp. E2]|eukprot:OUM62156.1 hypothetical protein PIROE2DRAFT_11657 [Piromyces sp. E2]